MDDPDLADTMTFGVQNPPVWAGFDTATGELSGTPLNEHVGSTGGIVISVADGEGGTDSLTAFSITVQNTNDAPVLDPIGDRGATAGLKLDIDVNATDVDLPVDTITYGMTVMPPGSSLDPGTGQFSWSPACSDVGGAQWTFTVSDGDLQDTETITITVSTGPVCGEGDFPWEIFMPAMIRGR